MSIVIRRFKESDLEHALDVLQNFFDEDRGIDYENHHKAIALDRKKMYNKLVLHLKDPDFFCSFIFQDEKIVGGLCASIDSPIYSSERIAYDHLFYVSPEFKHIPAVIRLLKEYMKWAERRNVLECHLCSSTLYKQDAFTKLCKKMGFNQFEIGFARRFR